MAEKLKEKIMWKHKVYRDYLKNGETKACTCMCIWLYDYVHVHYAITEVSQLIQKVKISINKMNKNIKSNSLSFFFNHC